MKVVVSRQADRDLIELYVFLHRQSPQAAERIAADIERCVANISMFPGVERRARVSRLVCELPSFIHIKYSTS
jgi:plasmid stabilization system protein ParE